jgi:hypothetical protein
LARLCGSKSARPVYMVQKGEESSGDTTKWVVITGSPGVDDGMPVAGAGLCCWDATIITPQEDAETFCEGEDRFVESTDVWVVVMDLLNGSGSSTPRLYKGDRFLGKLVGTYTVGEEERPLYAIRKGTQADIVEIVGDSPGDAVGAPASPNAAGLWDGITNYVTVGTTTFVDPATPYTAGPECWILAPDRPDGSMEADARLKKGDRYPAIFLGQFDHDGDIRPLYAIRKAIEHGWIKFKLNYALTQSDASQAANVLESWGGKIAPDDPVTVYNLETNTGGTYVFYGEADAVGYAVWDEKLSRYKIIVLESNGPVYGCLQNNSGSTLTYTGSLLDLAFNDETWIAGMTRKTTTPNGLTIDRAGVYLIGFTGTAVEPSPAGGTGISGSVTAYLYATGSAMAHVPISTADLIRLGGVGARATMAITHINALQAGDYIHVKIGLSAVDAIILGELTALWIGPYPE